MFSKNYIETIFLIACTSMVREAKAGRLHQGSVGFTDGHGWILLANDPIHGTPFQ